MTLGMEVGPSPCDFGDPPIPPKNGGRAHSPIFGLFLLWPNGWMHQCATEYGVRPQPGDFVLDGDPDPLYPKRGRSPQFSAHVYCGQTAAWIKMPLGTEVGLIQDDIVFDADPAPPPQYSAHFFYCSQTAGCIKMPLGMEVGLSPARRLIARWGPSPLPRKERSLAIFGPHLLWPNGCMDKDASTWYAGMPRPIRDIGKPVSSSC